ncbi:hypothetical protein AAIR98_001538 [Elusimicrobium simillimum]|uniref:epoxyqueuosine reductase QueH n=1 Tax=Elusimicrobium simillimum TaxID=3143438 RepID=UPI003C6F92D7
MPKTLLLSCCAPCSCAVIESLYKDNKDFTVLFYNPNIMPQTEYEKRKQENMRLCQKYSVPFIDLDYDNGAWLEYIKGLENEPERGERCRKCFRYRLARAAAYAKANGFDTFTSVLGVSKYKNLEDVNMIAAEIAAELGVPYDNTNWRKNGLEERRRALVKEDNIYNQTYCGCEFSRRR